MRDDDGNEVKYDMVGDRCPDDDDIIMFEEDHEEGLEGVPPEKPKEKAINLKRNKQRTIDHEAELMKLIE